MTKVYLNQSVTGYMIKILQKVNIKNLYLGDNNARYVTI